MSVSGTYEVVIKAPIGDQTGTMTVDAAGGSFSGQIIGAMGTVALQDGKVEGNTLTWKMDIKTPMPLTLDATATVDGDAITGSVQAGPFGSLPLTGRRAG